MFLKEGNVAVVVPSLQRRAEADGREASSDARELAVALAGCGFGVHDEAYKRARLLISS